MIEIEPLFELVSPYDRASYFCGLIRRELEIRSSFLCEQEAKNFATYYAYLDTHDGNRLNYFRHRYAQRVQHLVSVAEGQRILDAGCGLGSEAILCGILGAQVSGVDLKEQRLDVAKRRLQFYETYLSRTISVEFYAQSIFDINDSFDVIWANEAISHIDPVGRFIAFARDHLNQNGRLIISDSNALNPYTWWKAKRDASKRGGLYTKVRDPRTGEVVSYAQERILAVPSVRKLLTQNGFRIEALHLYGLLPYLSRFNWNQRNFSFYIERTLTWLPLIRWLSGIYVITGARG